MYQGLVMSIAVQICSEVAIRDVDDYTISFRFTSEEGVSEFVNELSAYSEFLSVSRFGLEVLVGFAAD